MEKTLSGTFEIIREHDATLGYVIETHQQCHLQEIGKPAMKSQSPSCTENTEQVRLDLSS